MDSCVMVLQKPTWWYCHVRVVGCGVPTHWSCVEALSGGAPSPVWDILFSLFIRSLQWNSALIHALCSAIHACRGEISTSHVNVCVVLTPTRLRRVCSQAGFDVFIYFLVTLWSRMSRDAQRILQDSRTRLKVSLLPWRQARQWTFSRWLRCWLQAFCFKGWPIFFPLPPHPEQQTPLLEHICTCTFRLNKKRHRGCPQTKTCSVRVKKKKHPQMFMYKNPFLQCFL